MKLKRIMIAAPKSGSGKTLVTCALLQALQNQGQQTVSFKCGPDYIDAMFHKKVTGAPSYNLDLFFSSEKQAGMLLAGHAAGGKTAVLEGVMGLYDGLGGIREECSSYHLAKVTKTPIILVADVKGMGYSILPFLTGFLQYDTEHLIRGVILNRISAGFFETVKPLLCEKLRVPVLGFLPDRKNFCIGSRHLGLFMPDEIAKIREKLTDVSGEFEKTVSLSAIREIAESAEALCIEEKPISRKAGERTPDRNERPVLAVARDEAFCFYYEDNLLMLEEEGARIKYFSPLHDKELPKGCHGILLGGGYPELYAKKLSDNTGMLRAVKRAAESGMPVVAECGGFLYLHKRLTDKEGVPHTMAGVVLAEGFDAGKPVRFGYIEIEEKKGCFLPEGEKIKGHEFHYYDSTDNGDGALAVKPLTGVSYPCVAVGENYWMGFPHLYYPSNPAFAKAFVEKADRYRKSMKTKCYRKNEGDDMIKRNTVMAASKTTATINEVKF